MPGSLTAKSVTLTNGSTVQIGWISWGVWKELKNRIISLISQTLTPEVTGRIVRQWEVFAAANPGESIFQLLQPQLLELVPGLAATLNAELDELTELIVRNCIIGRFPEEQLRAVDWMNLREAAAEVNDWSGMLDAEKNSVLVAFLGRGTATSAASTSSTPDGGSAGKPSSSPEAGAGETSSAAPPETATAT